MQGFGHFVHRGEPLLGPLGEHLAADVRQVAINLGSDAVQHGRLLAQYLGEDRHDRAGEGKLPGQQFIKHDSQTVDIGRGTDSRSVRPRLLGRHVGWRTDQHPLLRQPLSTDGDGALCEAEVHQDRLVVRFDDHVGRLQVAMDDPFVVSHLQGQRQLANQRRGRLWRRQAVRTDVVRQRPTFDQFHRDEPRAVDLTHVIHAADVRMAEVGCRPCLLQQPLAQFQNRVPGEMR